MGKMISIAYRQAALLAVHSFLASFDMETLKKSSTYASDYDIELRGVKMEVSVDVKFVNIHGYHATKFDFDIYPVTLDNALKFIRTGHDTTDIKKECLRIINDYMDSYDFNAEPIEEIYDEIYY